MIKKYRVHEVSKDLNLASKDILKLLETHFPDEMRKHMTALSDTELDVIFDYYTSQNAAESLDGYFALIQEAAHVRSETPKPEPVVQKPQPPVEVKVQPKPQQAP